MVIIAAMIDLQLPGVTSLKEKRGILKPLIARLHKTFNIAVAEVDLHDVWQSALLGVAIVSTSAAHAESKLESVLGWIERNRPDVTIVDHTFEVIHFN
ncbi:MAG: DUF503 domain-containing protein [Anaerolineae bacterium]|jgi:uncharacterized protein YlxP (DUF503 family)|nr:DUF503 domain-containing protein [Anaerolineae bacterium]